MSSQEEGWRPPWRDLPAADEASELLPGADSAHGGRPEPSERAPWELGTSDRPTSLPPPQPVPWQPTPGERDGPWDRRQEPAAAAIEDGPPGAPAGSSGGRPTGPVEVPPWQAPPWEGLPWDVPLPETQPHAGTPSGDEPVPSASDDEVAGTAADAYDAFAALADDLAVAPRRLRRRVGAPVAGGGPPPARHQVTRASSHSNESVFGDFFASASPRPAAERPPARDPVEWPPIPIDFRPGAAPAGKTAALGEPAAPGQPAASPAHDSHDPVDWPPIPHGVVHVPDREADRPAAAPSPGDRDHAEHRFEPPAGDFAPPDERDLGQPARSDAPPQLGDRARGGGETASIDEAARVTTLPRPADDGQSLAADDESGGAGDADRGPWFAATQPSDGAAENTAAAEAEPSALQTAMLTLLVALGVIALVIVFLALFTSVFQ